MRPLIFSTTPQDQIAYEAWHQAIAQTQRNSNLKQQPIQQQGELLPRFAEHFSSDDGNTAARRML